MKRLLLLFLLALFPLQASWAAVAAYCQHEEGQAAEHFGHHDHKHEASNADKSEPLGKAFAGLDLDCASCLGGHIKPLMAEAVSLPTLSAPPPALPRSLPYLSIAADLPEKPNWRVGLLAGEALSHT